MREYSFTVFKKFTTTVLSAVLVSGLLAVIPISAGHASPETCDTPPLTAVMQFQGGTIPGFTKKYKMIPDSSGTFAIDIPTRANYVFAGWLDDTSPNAGGVPYSGLSADSTSWAPSCAQKNPDTGYGDTFYLFAQWTPVSYVVTYDFQGATGNATAAIPAQYAGNNFLIGSYSVGSVVTLPIPEKTGYTFGGWAYGGNTRSAGYQFTMPNNAVTFVAQWTPVTYSISFNANGSTSGSVPDALSYTTGDAPTAISNDYNPKSLVRTNYTFGGWGLDAETTTAVSSYSGLSNITLYAIWIGSRYTVSFAIGSGATGTTPSSQVDKLAGSSITLPTVGNLVKTGSIFAGWGDGTNLYPGGSSYTVPNRAQTLTAVWISSTITITFDSNTATSGSLPATMTHNVGATFTRPANSGNLAKAGYLFIGWQDSNGTVVNSSYTPTGSTTFSARWEANQYQILYDYYDGRGWATSDWYSSGKAAVTLPVPTKAGYTFAGWFDRGGGTRLGDASNSYLTYTPNMACNNYIPCYIIWAAARWTANTYTISFDSNTATSGSVPANQNFTPGQAATTLSVPAPGSLVKPFYSFGGWSATAGGTSKVTSYNSIGDKIFYAIWNPVSNKVTFNSNGAGSTVSPSSATSTGGSLVTLPTPTRTGYTVSGWFDAASGGNKVGNAGATYQPNSAISIYAQWDANSNTVTFNANDGSGGTPPTQTITTGVATALTSSPVARTGYTLAGWAINADGSGTRYTNGQTVTIASGLNLYARWTANTNTVTFNNNGGSGSMASQNITSGVATNLRSKTFTRAGFTFAGWSTTQNGVQAYSDGQTVTITSGLTLWARWTK